MTYMDVQPYRGRKIQLSPSHLKQAAEALPSGADPVAITSENVRPVSSSPEDIKPTETACKLSLKVAFFFDGTGNNLKVDEPLLCNSNVARLFRAYPINDVTQGIYAFYIPGVGTPFPEIGDQGGKLGLGAGKGGDARINWALGKLEDVINAHPGASLKKLHISAFGFSRGAAEARAFANRVHKKCQKQGDDWHWQGRSFPVHFSFLGLFDTVAAVGMTATVSYWDSASVLDDDEQHSDLKEVLTERRSGQDGGGSGLEALAFGEVGANPTAGSWTHGHFSWGEEQAIPPIVEKCIHFVAMHEQRNSFAGDLVRDGLTYPDNCEEYIYPGMHSDVGGGYQPGAQGRSLNDRQKLSQMPLLAMYSKATEREVPFLNLGEIDARFRTYFQVTSETVNTWNHYMDRAGRGGKPLGEMALAHTRLWYQWRFHRIHHYLPEIEGKEDGNTLPNEATMQQAAEGFNEQHDRLKQQVDQAADRVDAIRGEMHSLMIKMQQMPRFGGTPYLRARQKITSRMSDLQPQLEKSEDRYNFLSHQLGSLASGDAISNITFYDKFLWQGMKKLQQLVGKHSRNNLRPHYRMLLECFEEAQAGKGLNPDNEDDQKIIDFFNHYTHDSLAGFHKDLTLPSDPRVFFDGDNNYAHYAANQHTAAEKESAYA